jgi:hypothetical protein
MLRLQKVGDWNAAEAITQALADTSFVNQILENIVLKGAEDLAALYKQAIYEGRSDWPVLSVVTIAVKGHDRPLVGRDGRSEIAEAIEVYTNGRQASVGIRAGSTTKDGDELDVVAAMQEFGAIIRVTDSMRGWFASKGFPLRADTEYINIPRRALFRPVFAENKMEIQTAMTFKALEVLLGPMMGATTLRVMR